MKVASRVLAIAAVLAMASAANADTSVWFNAVPSGGGAGVDAQGGPGGTQLMLSCNATGATVCTWTVTLAFANGIGEENLVSWAADLDVRPPGVQGKIDIVPSSFVYAANAFAAHSGTPTVTGPGLLRFANGLDLSGGAGSSSGNLASFTLRKTKAAGNSNMDLIAMTSGFVEWAGVFGAYPNINGIFEGGSGGTDLGNPIKIRNFPEPSSIALLGLGALALIRRR